MAILACKNLGMNLVSIMSSAEQDTIEQGIRALGMYKLFHP